MMAAVMFLIERLILLLSVFFVENELRQIYTIFC